MDYPRRKLKRSATGMLRAPGGSARVAVALFEKRGHIQVQVIDPGFASGQRRRRIDGRGEFSGYRRALSLLVQLIQPRRRD